MNSIYRPLIVNLLLLVSFAVNAADKLSVYAVNYPLTYFAQRIGGDHINPVFPLPTNIDPAFWEPDVKDIAGFQQADLILLNGAGYAKWLKRVSLPRRKLVYTSAAFQHDYIGVQETVTHQHGPGGDHSHAGTAFTTWLDFNQASMQAKAILLALEKARPEHADDFRQNFASLETELVELDETMKNLVSDDTDKLLIASHPVYQYLARRYHIKLKSLVWEPDHVPDHNQWLALQQLHTGHDASWMIWEGKPDAQSVARLQAMGISSLVFDPVANVPQEGNFMTIMKRNLLEIAKAYRLQ